MRSASLFNSHFFQFSESIQGSGYQPCVFIFSFQFLSFKDSDLNLMLNTK